MNHPGVDTDWGRPVRRAPLWGLLLLLVLGRGATAAREPTPPPRVAIPAPTAPPGPAVATSVTAAALAQARDLLVQGRYQAAADAFAAANQAEGGHCGACLLGEALAVAQLGLNSRAIDFTREAIAELKGNRLQGEAYTVLGTLLLPHRLFADVTPPGSAPAAEEAFRNALAAGTRDRGQALAGMSDAILQQGRYAEAASIARQALEAKAKGPAAGIARSTICRARSAGRLGAEAAFMPQVSQEPASASPPVTPGGKPASGELAIAEEPHLIGPGISRPVKIYSPPPHYCEVDSKAKTEGRLVLETIIDKDGCVAVGHVLKGLTPCLDRAGLGAVQGWVFEPARLDGKPVKVYYTLTVNFVIENGPAASRPPP